MSVQAMAWAIEQRTGNPALKCLLLSLANYADKHGDAWPKIATLAAEAEMSERSVHRHLGTLRDLGFVSWTHRHRDDGSRSSSHYKLAMGAARQAQPDPELSGFVGGDRLAPGPDTGGMPPMTPVAEQEPFIRTKTGGETYVRKETRAQARAESPPTPEPPPNPNPEPAPPPPPTSDTAGVPPRRCPEHIRTLGPVPACGACKEARLVAEQWEAAHPVSAANARRADAAPKHPACPDCHAPAPAGHCARCARNHSVATPGTVHALRAALPGRQRGPVGRRRECPHGRPVAWLDAAGTVEACPDCRRGVPGPETAADGVTGQRAATG